MRYEELENFWNNRAKALVGKTIKNVRYMTSEEAEEFGWHSRPIIIFFTDGTHIIPMRDDEGNDGGSVEGSIDELSFPVI